jgi:hypothetical protein
MGRGRWRILGAGRRRSYVGRHEAPRGTTAQWIAAVVVGMVAIAAGAVAVLGLGSPGSRGAGPARGRPPPPASNLIAAPGFGAGLVGWRAFPGSYLAKGQVGDPDANFAQLQRNPTEPAVTDPATRKAMAGLATRVVVSAQVGMPLRATVRVRGSRPGMTVLVRLSERVGDRRIRGSERRARLPDTAWREVGVDHRVVGVGVSIDLEIWAVALPSDAAIFVGQAKVASL